MGYGKEFTASVVHYWSLGLSAKETVDILKEKRKRNVGLATIYRHRKSFTAQTMIDELIRKQLRDIAASTDSNLKMKYRGKLLDNLMPKKVQAEGNITFILKGYDFDRE